jgi:hypothetical protein
VAPRGRGERNSKVRLRAPRLCGEAKASWKEVNRVVWGRMGNIFERKLEMRTLSKLALLALLALPFGSVFAQSTADVNITVTITGAADIVFDDGATHTGSLRSWTFSSALDGVTLSSSGTITDGAATPVTIAANKLGITNTSGSSFAVDITASVQAQGNWVSVLKSAQVGTLDEFSVRASSDGGTSFQELTGAGSFVITNLTAGSTTAANSVLLEFTAPHTVHTVHGGTINVRFLATLH